MTFTSNQMIIVVAALALAFVVMAVGLVIAVFYYRWRLHDSHRTLYRIIRENLELHTRLEKTSSVRFDSAQDTNN